MYGKHWIKEVCETNAMGFGNQAEKGSVAVKTPRTSSFDHFKAWFILPVEQLVGDSPCWIFVCQLNRFRTEPLNAHYCGEGVRQYATDCCVGLEIFELSHHAIQKRETEVAFAHEAYSFSLEKSLDLRKSLIGNRLEAGLIIRLLHKSVTPIQPRAKIFLAHLVNVEPLAVISF
jgi:hypothetical protein